MSTIQVQNIESISRKAVIEDIKLEVECSLHTLKTVATRIKEWKDSYLTGNIGKMYASKTNRVLQVKDDMIYDIANALTFSTIMLGECNIQSLSSHLSSQLKLDMDSWDKLRTASEIIAYCNGILYDIIRPVLGSGATFTIKPKIEISDDLKRRLSRCFFLPPETSVLDTWTNNFNGGYSFAKECAILGDSFNRHSEPLNLRVLNILQSVRYELVKDIIDTPEIASEDFGDEALKAFELAQVQTRKVLEDYRDSKFSFVFQYDKRGRIYSKGLMFSSII
ncbi:hypothetical protein CFT13S00388_02595 [Campylobacter fetus subsp. testudinum]|uniref:hypothetical protein n=1 Tax=Campylobacter fetus TaxID=196 RepID=UPI000818B114|nr:hypothetical protein [Campylobacter fetus]OCR88074.1 hypothetical protein CFT13S00388_02595 [Campylobacter fetus subsp. testudinum]